MEKDKMKAVVCNAYGPPEVLQIMDVDKPIIKDDEVLVEVMATTVNSGDVRVRALAVSKFMKLVMRLVIGINRPRKPVAGTVLSGIVVQVGKNVLAFKPGDEVMASTGLQFGAYAQYIALKAKGSIACKPTTASFEEAAAIVFGGLTAIYFLHKAGIQFKAGLNVLIYGATGSVGTAAVQIAKHYKARVTSVCGQQGVGLAQKLGSDEVVVYTQQDFTKLFDTFDIVFDAVGKTNKKACKPLIKANGHYITVEGMDVASETKEQLTLLATLFDNGELNANIDKTYAFANMVAAHRYVDTGRKKGNVVVTVNKG